MQTPHPYEKFRETVKPALESKLEEFRLMEYKDVTEEKLWNFFISKRWRFPKEDIRLYEIVDHILSLKPSDYLAYSQVEQLQQTDWFSEEVDPEEWKELLK